MTKDFAEDCGSIVKMYCSGVISSYTKCQSAQNSQVISQILWKPGKARESPEDFRRSESFHIRHAYVSRIFTCIPIPAYPLKSQKQNEKD